MKRMIPWTLYVKLKNYHTKEAFQVYDKFVSYLSFLLQREIMSNIYSTKEIRHEWLENILKEI